MRWKNAFAYGEKENVIDFQKLPGITSILGENGTGKSSMFHVMLFLMFAKSPKVSTQGEVINDRKKTAWMQYKFKVENDISGRRHASSAGERNSVNLYRVFL